MLREGSFIGDLIGREESFGNGKEKERRCVREATGGAFLGVGGVGVHRWHLWAQLKA